MSYDYAGFQQALALEMIIPNADVNNADFQAILPTIIDEAEQRCYRDCDFLSQIIRNSSGTLTANSRTFNFPLTYVVPESINVFWPVGTQTNRKQLVPVTREFLDAIWGNETAPTTPSIPDYYAMITDQQIIVGPPPDAAYTMEVIGTVRPTPLSASNPTTWLTLNVPDLFFNASMVFGVGYLKDYGAATDDPNAAGSWETLYQKTLMSANTEENRRKYASQAWTPKQISPFATPPRA